LLRFGRAAAIACTSAAAIIRRKRPGDNSSPISTISIDITENVMGVKSTGASEADRTRPDSNAVEAIKLT